MTLFVKESDSIPLIKKKYSQLQNPILLCHLPNLPPHISPGPLRQTVLPQESRVVL